MVKGFEKIEDLFSSAIRIGNDTVFQMVAFGKEDKEIHKLSLILPVRSAEYAMNVAKDSVNGLITDYTVIEFFKTGNHWELVDELVDYFIQAFKAEMNTIARKLAI